jgi:CSLREA domain-containing protein
VTLLNDTITDNSAHTGGGVWLITGGASNVRNTIVAGNLVGYGGVGPDVSGAFTSRGHNLVGDRSGSTGFVNGANGDQVGTAASPIDPRLAPLAINGGPTQTHALLAGSPAIDRGDNANAPATDQRGVARPGDGDGDGSKVVDIGAFEGRVAAPPPVSPGPGTYVVTTTLDVVNPADGKLSLREAIIAANAHPGPDTIVLPAGVYFLGGTIVEETVMSRDLLVTGSTTFVGAGAGATVIDARQISRVFDVVGTAPHSMTVTFQGLTIRNGLIDAGGGGGIRVGDADLVVQDCAITGNRTSGDGGGIGSNSALYGTSNVTLIRTLIEHNVAGWDGGGVFLPPNAQNQAGLLSASGSTIRRNLADSGAGLLVGRANLTGCFVGGNVADEATGGIDAGTLTMTSCNVSGNVALSASAGGIAVITGNLTGCVVSGNHVFEGSGGGFDLSSLTLTNCTVSGNTARFLGGGAWGGTLTLINTNFSGNAAGTGGGIDTTTVTLTNSTVNGNFATAGDGGGLAAATATLTGSTVSGNFTGRDGGGIKATTATLTGSTISGNFAGRDGGGVLATTVGLTNSTARGNTAGNDGGGVQAVTAATLTGSTVSGNTAVSGGGGIFAGVTATLTGCAVSGNTAEASFGGGLLTGTTATLTDCTVSGNSAVYGGGLSAGTMVTLRGSTLSGNSAARDGGGLFALGAGLTNCTVSGNSAGGKGGGLDPGFGLSLLNVTVTDNSAHTGGGVVAGIEGTDVRNSISAGNLVDLGGTGPDVSGAFTSGGHNLIGDGSGATGFANGVKGDQVGTAANPIDPRLGPLANNGGPTLTHALLAGSPAIDHGDNASAPATDQRGVARPRDGDGNGSKVVDVGAFER